MSKKKDYNGHEIISVYEFMSMCGLECEKNRGCLISHKAMRRKLKYRSKEFPWQVETPISLPFEYVSKERVGTGEVLLVEDDYEQICPYRKPYSLRKPLLSPSKEQQAKIREKLLKEIEESIKDSTIETLKPGEIKYLVRQSKKQQEEAQKDLENAIKEENEIVYDTTTEKHNRILKIGKRQYY